MKYLTRKKLTFIFFSLLTVSFFLVPIISAQRSNISMSSFGSIQYPEDPIEPIGKEINWYGIGSDWKVYMKDSSIGTALQRWETEIPKIKQWGFNTVRLAFRFDNEGDAHSLLNYQELDQVLSLMNENNLKVILDLHDWRDMYDYFGSQTWIDNWVNLAQYYKNNDIIIAYELFNEPFTQNWHSSVDGGGCGVGYGEGVMTALAECVDAIRATGDEHTIVYPDPWFIRPTETDVMHPERIAETLKRDNVIITFHLWQNNPDVFSIDYHMEQRAQAWINAGWDIWVGEMGVFPNRPWTEQEDWCVGAINYVVDRNIKGFNLWMHGYSSRDQAWSMSNEVLDASDFTAEIPEQW